METFVFDHPHYLFEYELEAVRVSLSFEREARFRFGAIHDRPTCIIQGSPTFVDDGLKAREHQLFFACTNNLTVQLTKWMLDDLSREIKIPLEYHIEELHGYQQLIVHFNTLYNDSDQLREEILFLLNIAEHPTIEEAQPESDPLDDIDLNNGVFVEEVDLVEDEEDKKDTFSSSLSGSKGIIHHKEE